MSEAAAAPPAPAAIRRLAWAGFWLGFGLGGFFDGILLHQILQWHHLLSGVAPSDTVPHLRFQVLADGLFHALTYAFTLVGLWLLWTARAGLDAPGAGTRLTGWGLVGFGVWHVADAILFHWTLGLHRIRMDTASPLLWDLGWFVPFGLGALGVGLWLLRAQPSPGRGAGRGAALSLGIAALVAGPIAALPPAGMPGDRTLAVFRAGMGLPEIALAAEAVGGTPIWSDARGGVWLIALEPGARPAALYRHGALLVASGPFAAGCLSWAET